jgi:hypothetical protein
MTMHRSLIVLITALFLTFPVSLIAQEEAVKLRYAEPTEGTLDAGEKAVYTFTGQAGEKPIIVMNGKGGEIDPVLQLYNPEGQLIAEDDNSNGKDNARIENVVLAENGEYRVEALNNAQGTGEFSLIINEEERVILYHGGGTVPGVGGEFQVPTTGAENYELSAPWPYTDLTYTVVNTLQGFNEEDVLQVIRDSFQAWANETPLTFTEVYDDRADIIIEFGPIDGPSQVLGQACPPSSPCAGSVQFDSDEYWILREPQSFTDISLLGVATHEFGHVIGLLHSDDASALMYPQYSPYNIYPGEDDILGVQRLYGPGQGTVNNPTPQPGQGGGDPSTVVATITDEEYVHFWDFDVYAGESVTIRMQELTGGLDPLLVILDENDNVLAYDDDSGGDVNAEIRNISFPEDGTYTVAATRYQLMQGYSEGEYELSIEYGVVEDDPQDRPRPTDDREGSAEDADGSVVVSEGSPGALEEYTPLDSALTGNFVDSKTPVEQNRSGTVFAEQVYTWDIVWCARDEATLEENLAQIDVTFEVNGEEVDRRDTRVFTSQQQDLFCGHHMVLLSDWQGSSIFLQATLTLNDNIFDGMNVYQRGDYVYTYDLEIR